MNLDPSRATTAVFFLLQVMTAILSLTQVSASSSSHHPRRRLLPGNSIAQEMRDEHAKGNAKPKFTLVGEVAGTNDLYTVNVREANPAVTSETTFSEFDGPKEPVGELSHSILVADHSEEDDELNIVLISVDKKTDKVNGVVHDSQGKKMKFTQNKGQNAFAYDAPEFEPPAWSCGVTQEQEVATRRDLLETGDSQLDHEIDGHLFHDHEGHEHHGHNEHHHEHHSHSISYDDLHGAISELKESLRGSTLKFGKRRKLQPGVSYSFQVDVYIEIDQALVDKNSGSLAQTLLYIDAIFAGANTIYEEEVDTHLHVAHVDLNSNYNLSADSGAALTTMRNIWSSQGFAYHPGMDIHHALLARGLGGGVAYVGVVCNTAYGYGLSGNLSGGYRNMDSAAVWDMMVFMHEVGHNFNTGHTHDGGYSPRIDVCGCAYTTQCSDPCPAQLPLAKSATLMSYCHTCTGGMSNMAYTFGGKYSGSGSRSDMLSYANSALAGTLSSEPRQIPPKMYAHVSTRGNCVALPTTPAPTGTPTPQPTKQPVAPTNPPTKAPTNTPTKAPTDSPTTSFSPSKAPTPLPTNNPTLAPTPAPTEKPTPCIGAGGQGNGNGCIDSLCCSGACESAGKPADRTCTAPSGGPPPPPTSTPPPTPPTAGPPTSCTTCAGKSCCLPLTCVIRSNGKEVCA